MVGSPYSYQLVNSSGPAQGGSTGGGLLKGVVTYATATFVMWIFLGPIIGVSFIGLIKSVPVWLLIILGLTVVYFVWSK